jgi:hypothetical protein
VIVCYLYLQLGAPDYENTNAAREIWSTASLAEAFSPHTHHSATRYAATIQRRLGVPRSTRVLTSLPAEAEVRSEEADRTINRYAQSISYKMIFGSCLRR